MNISQKKLEKSKGRLEIKIKNQNLQKLYQQGSSKALMPDFHENLKNLEVRKKLQKFIYHFGNYFGRISSCQIEIPKGRCMKFGPREFRPWV